MALGRDAIITFHALDNVIDVDFGTLTPVGTLPGQELEGTGSAAAPGPADVIVITNMGITAGISLAGENDAYVTVDEQAAFDADNVVVLGASAPVPALDP